MPMMRDVDLRQAAQVSRALPSFSVIEIIPVSATAKVRAADAHVGRDNKLFTQGACRAIIVNSSGSFVGCAAEFLFKQRADLPAGQVHRGEHEMVRPAAASSTMYSPRSLSTTS